MGYRACDACDGHGWVDCWECDGEGAFYDDEDEEEDGDE